MAVDRHVERVSKRIGLLPPKATPDQAHDLFLGLLEPEEMYAAHVLLIHHGRVICHAQNPKHDLCPVRDRCRYVDKRGALTPRSPSESPMPNPQLDAALTDLLDADFAFSPVTASGYGLTDYDDRMDDVSADAQRARDAAAVEFLTALDAIGDEGLTTDETIDRDLARAVLRGRTILAPFEAWRRDPVDVLRPDHQRRVRAVPAPAARRGGPRRRGGLAAGGRAGAGRGRDRQPRPGPRPSADRGAGPERGQGRGALPARPRLAGRRGRGRRERMRVAGEGAAAHLERFVARLDELVEQAHGSWQLGEERYSRVLREREVLPDDARAAPRARPARVRPARRRDAGPRRGRDRQPGLRRGPARRTSGAPDAPSRRCSTPTPSGPSGRGSSSWTPAS